MVITGVAEQAADRLAHLVYLDAFVPGDGQSLLGLLPEAAAQQFRQLAAESGDGWRVPPLPGTFGITAEADRTWLLAHLVTQPLATFEQPVHRRSPAAAALPRSYIFCSDYPTTAFVRFAEQVRADAQWRYRELHTGHDAMVTVPEELAALLVEALAAPTVAD
jgi:hypothetical protein